MSSWLKQIQMSRIPPLRKCQMKHGVEWEFFHVFAESATNNFVNYTKTHLLLQKRVELNFTDTYFIRIISTQKSTLQVYD